MSSIRDIPLDIMNVIHKDMHNNCIETFEMVFTSDYAETFSIKLWRNFLTDPVNYIQVELDHMKYIFYSIDLLIEFFNIELQTITDRNDYEKIYFGYYQGSRPSKFRHCIENVAYFDASVILYNIRKFASLMMIHITDKLQIVLRNKTTMVESFEMKFIPEDSVNHPVIFMRIWRDVIKDPIDYIRVDLLDSQYVFRSIDLLIHFLRVEIETITCQNLYDKIYYGYYQGTRPDIFRNCFLKYDYMFDWQDIIEYFQLIAKSMMKHTILSNNII